VSRAALPVSGLPTVGPVVAGLLLFALGLLVAGRVLPEWQGEGVPSEAFFLERTE
jgi:hypothetical protein